MTDEFFSIDQVTSLSELAPGSKVHIIGVCGVAMAPLAIELANKGFKVSGSDKEFYDPMGTLLHKSKVNVAGEYTAGNVPADAALVVIGNAVSGDHVEVCSVKDKKLPYSCFPKLLFDLIVDGHHSIVVSGTHGKSTITSLAASALFGLRADPSFFMGGLPKGFALGLRAGKGDYAVVEGDEYDSAFFAKVAKFSFYKPNTLIITGIEYDHSDIYDTVDQIKQQFTNLVLGMPQDGVVICCVDSKEVKELLSYWRENSQARIFTYGSSSDADYQLISSVQQGLKLNLRFCNRDKTEISANLPLIGKHNAQNALSVFILLELLGYDHSDIAMALSKYPGLKRRQDIRFSRGGITLIDDFAHHPTEVRETISAVRSAFPDSKLWAVFEPRSNTSRTSLFQKEYVAAFSGADKVVISEVLGRSSDRGKSLLDVQMLSRSLTTLGIDAIGLPDVSVIRNEVCGQVEPGDVVLVMSNGSFGGLVSRLANQFNQML